VLPQLFALLHYLHFGDIALEAALQSHDLTLRRSMVHSRARHRYNRCLPPRTQGPHHARHTRQYLEPQQQWLHQVWKRETGRRLVGNAEDTCTRWDAA
jgi:hypothetical protein